MWCWLDLQLWVRFKISDSKTKNTAWGGWKFLILKKFFLHKPILKVDLTKIGPAEQLLLMAQGPILSRNFEILSSKSNSQPKIYLGPVQSLFLRFWTQKWRPKWPLKVDLTKIGPAEQLLLRAQGSFLSPNLEISDNLGGKPAKNLARLLPRLIFRPGPKNIWPNSKRKVVLP